MAFLKSGVFTYHFLWPLVMRPAAAIGEKSLAGNGGRPGPPLTAL